jgi:hypothetical protein
MTLVLSPSQQAHSFRRAEGSLEIRCSHKAIADEIQESLSSIVKYSKAAWLGHCTVFSALAPEKYECGGAAQSEQLAMDEEFRWFLSTAAYAKVLPTF